MVEAVIFLSDLGKKSVFDTKQILPWKIKPCLTQDSNTKALKNFTTLAAAFTLLDSIADTCGFNTFFFFSKSQWFLANIGTDV